MVREMQIEMLKLTDLKLDPDNPRHNSGAVEKLADAIRRFGFRVPIVVNSDHMILAGHTRFHAAAMLGMTEVPCIVADDMSAELQREFNVVDNRIPEFSFWDIDKLSEQVATMAEEAVSMFDLDALVIDDIVDLDEDTGSRKERPSKRDGLDLAPFEKYQYVTVVCRSTYDYLNLLERLGIENVQGRYVNGVLKRGSSYGRVIEYADLVKLLAP